LKLRDHIAYVRFASVYRNFQDLDEFYEELRDLDERKAQRELRRYQQELPFGSNGDAARSETQPAETDLSGESAEGSSAREPRTR
jgi:transcriptional repressor NrdR